MATSPPLTPGVTLPIWEDAPFGPFGPIPNPLGGFWAVRPDPDYDVEHRQGRMRVLPPTVAFDSQNCYPQAMPVIFDFSSSQIDNYALFQLDFTSKRTFPKNTDGDGLPLSLAPTGNFLDIVRPGISPDQELIANQSFQFCDIGAELSPIMVWNPQYIYDLGAYHFRLGLADGLIEDGGPFTYKQTKYSNYTFALNRREDARPPAANLEVMFRFFPDGTKMAPLNAGEVALFQECDYQGKASVFVADTASFAALSSSDITLDKTAASIKLGPGTSVRLHSGVDYTGVSQTITEDTACLSGTPDTSSIEILPAKVITLSSHQCSNCQLQGIDTSFLTSNLGLEGANLSFTSFAGDTFSGLDLEHANLTSASFAGGTFTNLDVGGANLSWADLSGAHFPGAGFAGAILGNATITCTTDFSGTPDSPHDLSTANFGAVQFPTATNTCRTNFSNTVLSATTLPLSALRLVNLTGASFTGMQGHPLSSQANPLNLSGAMLQQASFDYATLDYAQGLAGADLTHISFSNASLQHVNLSGALLYGAHLDSANLDGANLSGAYLTKPPGIDSPAASLQGAFLRNVNLYQARISGANFANANFYSTVAVGTSRCSINTGFTDDCATASQAVMDLTNFSGAYLFGVDFTGATAQGVQFGNSFLAGANFTNAKLSTDTSGTDTGFSSTYLQGANLAGASFANGISFSNAFVDFTPAGNIIYLLLDGNHTTFAGYWGQRGEPVCAQMTYSGPTTVPTTNREFTCPDGNNYNQGCGSPSPAPPLNVRWESPVDITTTASYANNSTYTPAAAQAICTADLQWIPINFGHKPPRGKNR
jgi:uncharacterized protein YjbI with pentapeptide repeats